MNKKIKLIIVPIIILIIGGILLLTLTSKNQTFTGESTQNCDHTAKLYFEEENQRIYTYCLENIRINSNDNEVELIEYLNNNSIDDLIAKISQKDSLFDGKSTIYKDGGTKKIQKGDITFIKCKTLDGSNDIYIGDSTLDFRENFCRADNTTFTRTYTILNIEEYKEQQYENGTPVTYGRSLKATLKEDEETSTTVIINNVWDNLEVNKTYEFEFILYDKTIEVEDTVEAIFKNCGIVEVRETSNSNPRHDSIK